STRLADWSRLPSTTLRNPSGLMTSPQSCAHTKRLTRTLPVSRFTSTSAIVATSVPLPPPLGADIPRPVTMGPAPRDLGEGRASHSYVSAAALSTAIARILPALPLAGRYFKRN